jgi:uncharacterized protein YPO0396
MARVKRLADLLDSLHEAMNREENARRAIEVAQSNQDGLRKQLAQLIGEEALERLLEEERYDVKG